MKLLKLFLFVLVWVLSMQVGFGQDSELSPSPESWLMEYNIYTTQPVYLRYDRYSKEDIVRFREKLDLLKTAKFSDEWEGIYYRGVGDDVGISSFRLDSKAGFVNFYIYTCFPELRYINYGQVSNITDFIIITPEFAIDSSRKASPVKYIKIKWNDRNYLVEDSSLPAFAEKIVGIYVEPEDAADENYQKWANYWVKGGTEKKLTGLPEFPPSYKKFQRLPIETKITAVGKRTMEKEIKTADWLWSAEEIAVYHLTIGGGADKGIKKGMIFHIDELDENILITEVKKNSAVGILARTIDEQKNDYCQDDEYNQIACPKIKPYLKIKTEIGLF